LRPGPGGGGRSRFNAESYATDGAGGGMGWEAWERDFDAENAIERWAGDGFLEE
jgi:hypothetical protein